MAAIQKIVEEIKLPIDFESQALDPKTEGVTVSQLYKRFLQKASAGQLTAAERSQLKSIGELEKTSPESIITWDLPQAHGKIHAKNPGDLLTQYCAAYPAYRFQSIGGHFVVLPKKSLLDFKMGPLSVRHQTLGQVVTTISPQLEKHHIAFLMLVMGRVPDYPNRMIETLELPESTAREFLTQLVQAAGPDIVWWLGGFGDSRALQFLEFR